MDYHIKTIPSAKICTAQTLKICCSTRIGSSLWGFLATFVLINSAAITLEVDLVLKGHIFLLPVELILHVSAIALMIATTCVNPGVIPQYVPGYEIDQEHFEIPSCDPPINNYMLTTNNLLAITKYCRECRIYRPLRTIHCAECNHCVEGFDHHCPWIGVCIGKRNYKLFISFITMTTLLTLFSACVAAYEFAMAYTGQFLQTVVDNIQTTIVFVLAFWFFISLLCLFGYHGKILQKGLTTNEDLKEIYESVPIDKPFRRASTLMRPHSMSVQVDDYFFKSPIQTHRFSDMSNMGAGRTIELQRLDTGRSNTKSLLEHSLH